ncbi:CDP-glucose 4,6-dehydratase [Chitinophaga niabensis]|uniref:CDP-glucose 4,6-dehydratase n=1 Tax=Chitinophaga niabensis TaxID=536979 RepID=UPI0031BB45A9
MLKNIARIYKDKKVFITGHTGFKGAWLLKILSMAGAEIRGYALSPLHENDAFNILNGPQLCDSIINDLRNKKELTQSIIDFQPDFIFHLAAQPLVRLSYDIPAETFEVNAIGTANVLDAVRLLNKPCQVILITTDKVYHNNEWIYPYRENDRLGGYDPYSASKACAELVIDSYRNSFFNIRNYSQHQKGIAVGRAGNVIGGGDWAKDRLLPDIARALGNNQKVIIRNPHSVRPWQHVLEPLAGYLKIGEKLTEQPELFSTAYNLGPHVDDALSVAQMVKIAIDCWGNGDFQLDEPPAHTLHEAGLLKLDINKAAAELGWKPVMNAHKAVSQTINWYKTYYTDPGALISLTAKQITDFFDE